MLLSPNAHALPPPMYQHPHSLLNNQSTPPPISSSFLSSTPSRGRPPFRLPSDPSHNNQPPTQAVPWTRPLLAHINPQASSTPLSVPTQSLALGPGVTPFSPPVPENDPSPQSSSGRKTPRARPEGQKSDSPQPPSPTSPVGGGRSILTMLLDRERERHDSTTSVVTVKAPGAVPAPNLGDEAGERSSGAGSTPSPPTPTRPGSVTSVQHVESPRKLAFSAPAHVRKRSSSSAAPSSPQVDQTPARAPRSLSRSGSGRKILDEEEGRPLLEDQNYLGVGNENGGGGGYGAIGSPLGNGYASSYSNSSPRHHFLAITPPPGSPSPYSSPFSPAFSVLSAALTSLSTQLRPKSLGHHAMVTIETLPAVSLGLLLNILDGVSYGFIMFPAGPVFAGFGSMGVSMFFLT